jgi:hypothetical protein
MFAPSWQSLFLKREPQSGDGFGRSSRKALLMTVRTGEPPIMSFIKRAKILATCVYEFFEGGDIDTIANAPDKLVWWTNRTAFSDLGKPGIHQAFGEFIVHTRTVAAQAFAAVLRGELPTSDLGKPPTIKTSNHRSDGYLKR